MAQYTNAQDQAAQNARAGGDGLILIIATEVVSRRWPQDVVNRMQTLNGRTILLQRATNGIVAGNPIPQRIRVDLQVSLDNYLADASVGDLPETVTDGIPTFRDAYQAMINLLP